MLVSIVGGVILFVSLADFLQTTLGAQKAGRITRVVAAALWVLARGLRATGPWVHRYSGPFILALVAAYWIAVHWFAWVLIHRGVHGSVVIAQTSEPASLWQTIAYVGASLSTLGASLAEPAGPGWDVVSALAAINGMVVLTLSVTFVLNITQTVAEGRTFAARVRQLEPGNRAHDDELIERLTDLATKLNAYPLALYFSTRPPERRIVPAICRFVDDVLTHDKLAELSVALDMLPGIDPAGLDDPARARECVRAWARRNTLDGAGVDDAG